jgi:hypothetical protein
MMSLIAGLLVPGVLAGYFLAADASSGHVPAQPAALAMDRSMALPIAGGPASLDPSQSARARSSNERADPALQHAAIRWAGADLLIDLERVPVRQAIQMLAAETQTSVRGGEHIGARLVTFKWQGRDVQAAWHQLLGPLSGFSLACASGSCQMLIDGPAAAAVTLAGAARAPHGAAAGAESPPDGAEEPITTDE